MKKLAYIRSQRVHFSLEYFLGKWAQATVHSFATH
jgi:hypothetical protein